MTVQKHKGKGWGLGNSVSFKVIKQEGISKTYSIGSNLPWRKKSDVVRRSTEIKITFFKVIKQTCTLYIAPNYVTLLFKYIGFLFEKKT